MNNSNNGKTPEENYQSTFTRRIIDINELNTVLKPNSNHGLCGGHNLGNTCFMNSSIACLSNCTELTTYFLTGKYKDDINKNNKEGLKGKLAKAWYELLAQYWNSTKKAGNPSEIKSTVAKKEKKFGTYDQQDSNEFMTVFLSILNEDLNKTTKKEYKELKEKQKDESELDCAKRFWNLHVKLNDSIITDLFSGLFKSSVTCNKCSYESIRFQPFNTLILAIPHRVEEIYEKYCIFYIPKFSIRQNIKIVVEMLRNSSLQDLIGKIKDAKEFKNGLEKLKFIKVADQKFLNFIDEKRPINSNDFIFAFDDLSKENEKNFIIPLYMSKDDEISAFPRLLFFEENTNFDKLKRQIYYFARNYFKSPFKDSIIDEELNKYKTNVEDYKEEELWKLFDKEYDQIFKEVMADKKEEVDKFLNNFPYVISIKKKFKDKESLIIFDGKNNFDNLKEFNILKDEDSIINLMEKIEKGEFCINLKSNTNSSFSVNKINLNTCSIFNKKEKKYGLTLDNLLKYFGQSEELEKGNEWQCTNCKKCVSAKKKNSIYYTPKLLIICLNRFTKVETYFGTRYSKNNDEIDFPLENLNMGNYICGPDKEHSVYDLFAVSQHSGDTGGGHYTAVCKNIDGNWYDYDDSSCSDSSKNIVSYGAYVLFYRRRTW